MRGRQLWSQKGYWRRINGNVAMSKKSLTVGPKKHLRDPVMIQHCQWGPLAQISVSGIFRPNNIHSCRQRAVNLKVNDPVWVRSCHIHMAVDLKVLVRSFNGERCACHVGNPHGNCFEFAKYFFIRESFAKVGYYESLLSYTLQLVKGYHPLPPGVRQENGTAP